MRKHAEWMTIIDDRILEHLRAAGPRRPNEVRQSLATRGNGMEYSQSVIDARIDRLHEYGLVRKSDNRWQYELAEKGVLYLKGEFDAANLLTSHSTPSTPRSSIDTIDD
ncbi:MAG: hypothetical protein ACQETB_09215 [Halobacteriota archaeon]